jgi:hypothetical protein
MNATSSGRRFTMPPPPGARQPEPSMPTPILTSTNLSWSTMTMNQNNTTAWVTYTYASFGAAAGMTALGIWALPADLWVKGYLSMAVVFLIGSCFTLAKTVRDEHESRRLANRIEDAKAEKLLMGIERT